MKPAIVVLAIVALAGAAEQCSPDPRWTIATRFGVVCAPDEFAPVDMDVIFESTPVPTLVYVSGGRPVTAALPVVRPGRVSIAFERPDATAPGVRFDYGLRPSWDDYPTVVVVRTPTREVHLERCRDPSWARFCSAWYLDAAGDRVEAYCARNPRLGAAQPLPLRWGVYTLPVPRPAQDGGEP